MKKLIALGITLFVAFQSISVSAQDLNEIVKNHIAAIGGADNWSKLKSMTSEMTMKAQGAEIKVVVNLIPKKAMRADIEVMGMNGYQIMTDKEGWSFMPFAGQTKAEPSTPDDVKAAQDNLDIVDQLITYKDYGKKIDYLGKDDVEGTECHKIALTNKEGEVTTFFIDPSTYYVIKEVSKKKANGKEFEMTKTYGNYKKLEEGIVFPMLSGGDQGEMEITKVTINKPIDEAMFQPKSLSELKK